MAKIKNEMETRIKYSPRVVNGRVELWVPYHDKEIAFAHNPVRGNTYSAIGQSILKNGQMVPNGEHIASLLHAAFCIDAVKRKPEFMQVREMVFGKGDGSSTNLVVFNRILYSQNGVYVVLDEDAIGRTEHLHIQDLEKTLRGGKDISGVRFSIDRRVRFAPKETYLREGNYGKWRFSFVEHTTPDSIAENGFMIANFGEEGAKKLAEVSTKFRKLIVFNLNERSKEYNERIREIKSRGSSGYNPKVDNWSTRRDGQFEQRELTIDSCSAPCIMHLQINGSELFDIEDSFSKFHGLYSYGLWKGRLDSGRKK